MYFHALVYHSPFFQAVLINFALAIIFHISHLPLQFIHVYMYVAMYVL